MPADEASVHSIVFTLQLKQINILVKFPCSIAFALKQDNLLNEHKGMFELTKGQCLINETIKLNIDVVFDKLKYQEQKVSLIVYMVSPNGKIPAGSVFINPTDVTLQQKIVHLEKCPDKNAEVIYSQSFQVLRISSISEISKKSYHHHYLTQSNVSRQSEFGLHQKVSEKDLKHSSSSSNVLPIKHWQHKKLRESIIQSKEGSLHSQRGSNFQPDLIQESKNQDPFRMSFLPKSNRVSEKQVSEARNSRASNRLLENQNYDLSEQKEKILKLEQQKTAYIKEIIKLKSSSIPADAELNCLEEQLVQTKHELTIVQDEVEKWKEKCKWQERREKENNQAIKELKDESDRRQIKYTQLEAAKQILENQLSDKDKQYHELQTEFVQFKQSFQELEQTNQSLFKKGQLRQSSYRQQFKKLNEKYAQSQAERQKILFDYNLLLGKIEEIQRKNQLSLKEKERNMIEEKNKFAKQIENITNQLESVKEENRVNHHNIEENKVYSNKWQMAQTEYIQRISNLENRLCEIELKEKECRSESERTASELMIAKENSDWNQALRKKNQQLSQQVEVMKDKLQKLSLRKKEVEVESQQHRINCDAIQKEKKELEHTQHTFSIAYAQLKDQLNAEKQAADTLSHQVQSHILKINEYKNSLAQERKNYQSMENKYEEQVQYLAKSKEYLENQISEMRWLIQKDAEKYEILDLKNKDLHQDVFLLNHTILELKQRENRAIEEKEQNNHHIQHLEIELAEQSAKEKFKLQTQKEKEDQIYALNKQIKQKEQQIFINQQREQALDQELKEKKAKWQLIIQQKDKACFEQQEEITFLNQQIEDMQNEANQKRQAFLKKQNELLFLKDQILNKNELLNDLQFKMDSLLKNQASSSSNLLLTTNEKTLLENHLKEKVKELEETKIQFNKYKIECLSALQGFFELLLSQSSNPRKIIDKSSTNIMEPKSAFPDEKLRIVEAEGIKRYRMIWSKMNNELKITSQSLKEMEEKLVRVQNQAETKQFQLEEDLFNLREEISTTTELFHRDQQKYEETIGTLEEKIMAYATELESLHHQIASLEEKNQQQQSDHFLAKDEIKNYHQEISKAETEIDSLKRSMVTSKHSLEDQIGQLKKQLKLIQNNFELLQSKHDCLNKSLAEKQSEIDSMIKLNKRQQEDFLLKSTQTSQEMSRSQQTNQQRIALVKRLQLEVSELKQSINELLIKKTEMESTVKAYLNEIASLQKEKLNLKECNDELQAQLKQIKMSSDNSLSLIKVQLQSQMQQLENTTQLNFKNQQKCKDYEHQIISLLSQISLKSFQIEDFGQKNKIYHQDVLSLSDQLKKTKSQLTEVRELMQNERRKYLQIQATNEEIEKEAKDIQRLNEQLRDQAKSYESEIAELQTTDSLLEIKNAEIQSLTEDLFAKEQKFNEAIEDLKVKFNEARKEVSQASSKLEETRKLCKELEKQVQEKQSNIGLEIQRVENSFEQQRSQYYNKLVDTENRYEQLREQLQFQKEQYGKEIQNNGTICQELNFLLQEKEEKIESQTNIIQQNQIRIQELHHQLNECISKWEHQKNTYMPAKDTFQNVQQELNRVTNFVGEFDGRFKQLVEISKRKAQSTSLANSQPTVYETLKEINVILHKFKTKIIAKLGTQKEKGNAIAEFKAVQEKIDFLLKSTQSAAK